VAGIIVREDDLEELKRGDYFGLVFRFLFKMKFNRLI